MQILLIRHGQSEADILDVHEGRADFSLTSEGCEQANRMARRVLQEFPPEFIWASTLKRASETASILQETINCPIEFLPELQERNNGDLAGKPAKEVSYPSNLLPHEKLGTTGETQFEFRARAEHALSYIIANSQSYNRIAIVAHGWMITNLFHAFLGMPMVNDVYFLTGDTGIHLLEINERGSVVHFTNSTTHLK